MIEQARELSAHLRGSGVFTRIEAADTINALVAEVERLQKAVAQARSDALEEAAKVCEEWHDLYGVRKECASDVRSLKEKQ